MPGCIEVSFCFALAKPKTCVVPCCAVARTLAHHRCAKLPRPRSFQLWVLTPACRHLTGFCRLTHQQTADRLWMAVYQPYLHQQAEKEASLQQERHYQGSSSLHTQAGPPRTPQARSQTRVHTDFSQLLVQLSSSQSIRPRPPHSFYRAHCRGSAVSAVEHGSRHLLMLQRRQLLLLLCGKRNVQPG